MADTKISALPAVSSVASADLVPIVQGGVTSQAAIAQIAAAVGGLKSVTLAVGFADLAVADVTDFLDFASALPAGAMFQAPKIVCTEAFAFGAPNEAVTLWLRLGVATNDDVFGTIDPAVGTVSTVYGGDIPFVVRAETPRATFGSSDPSVNLDTLVSGAAVITIFYTELP